VEHSNPTQEASGNTYVLQIVIYCAVIPILEMMMVLWKMKTVYSFE